MDTPGVYRGFCAEFCGHQHAHMALTIVAEPVAAFQEWLGAQRLPADTTAADTAARVFLTRGCALCHTVRGTVAGGRQGPDLTHLASRRTLAAGTLPRTRNEIRRWVENPQRFKPGVRMPITELSAAELDLVTAFLERLQ